MVHIINPFNVIALLLASFNTENKQDTPVNIYEEELKDYILNIIQQCVEGSFFIAEQETYLDIDNSYSRNLEDIDPDWFDENEGNRPYHYAKYEEEEVPCQSAGESVNFEYKRKAVEFWNSGKSKRLKIDTVRARFKLVKSETQLRRWANQVEEGGSYKEKVKRITENTFQKFMEARESKIMVHDIDLRRWALQAKITEDLPSFKAGHTWLWNFKKHFGIVSRKVTRFITKTAIRDEKDIDSQNKAFLAAVKPYIVRNGPANVFNSDQSGFNLEIHSGRTLEEEGTKIVQGTVQSISSTTHSYTIQPTISADGQLLSPLFVVLKESSGQFGPNVKKHMFKAENIFVMASKSGKLTTEHFKTWLKEVYFPNTNRATVLLLDSWSGHCKRTVHEVTPKEKELKLFSIPKGTTKYLQPLDVYGFRTWKNFVRRFSDIVILFNYNINLHTRDNIIKLQSLVHNQFSSPMFQNFIKYSWYRSGYIENRPNVFKNPVEYCYSVENEPKCSVCDDIAIIKCAWCKKSLCFKHFFYEYHYPYSTEMFQEHCIDITLKHCNIAWRLRNVSATLLQDCGNVEMSALRNITMKRYSNVAMCSLRNFAIKLRINITVKGSNSTRCHRHVIYQILQF